MVSKIIFRNRNGTGPRKIYVDTDEAAAKMASKYRHASYWVDVISRYDEVRLRWENGSPDWSVGEIKPEALDVDVYRFDRPEDDWWNAESRLWMTHDALKTAFDIAVDRGCRETLEAELMRIDDHGNADLEHLFVDAMAILKETDEMDEPENWALVVSDWMSNPERLFLPHYVEHNALMINIYEPDEYLKDIAFLGVDLATLEAKRVYARLPPRKSGWLRY